MNKVSIKRLMLFVAVAMAATQVPAGETNEDKIARARSAAHPAISAGASVHDVDGRVLQQGANDWVCMPGIGPGDNHPMCNGRVWMKLMHAVGTKEDFSTDRIGVSYMLQGDAHVSNSDPYATDPGNGDVWVQEGPHLMIVVPKALLAGISDDPASGGPYVMWKDTPYAHLMVPVEMPR